MKAIRQKLAEAIRSQNPESFAKLAHAMQDGRAIKFQGRPVFFTYYDISKIAADACAEAEITELTPAEFDAWLGIDQETP